MRSLTRTISLFTLIACASPSKDVRNSELKRVREASDRLHLSGNECFHGCGALGEHSAAEDAFLDKSQGRITLVVSWCCESLSWINKKKWLGMLFEVVLYAKCTEPYIRDAKAYATRIECDPEAAVASIAHAVGDGGHRRLFYNARGDHHSDPGRGGGAVNTSGGSTDDGAVPVHIWRLDQRGVYVADGANDRFDRRGAEASVHHARAWAPATNATATTATRTTTPRRALGEDEERSGLHAYTLHEPGRKHCFSTDECGAYLTYLVDHYDALADGILFMQGDGGVPHRGGIPDALLKWTSEARIAPAIFYPLSTNFGAGGNPKGCLDAIDKTTLRLERAADVPFNLPKGYRNGIFYVSRHVVWRRERAYYAAVLGIVNNSAACFYHTGRPCDDGGLIEAGVLPPRDACATPLARSCAVAPCNVLEHSWHAFFCEPCAGLKTDKDSRVPWGKK